MLQFTAYIDTLASGIVPHEIACSSLFSAKRWVELAHNTVNHRMAALVDSDGFIYSYSPSTKTWAEDPEFFEYQMLTF